MESSNPKLKEDCEKEPPIEVVDHQDRLSIKRHGKVTYYAQRLLEWYAFFKKKEQYLALMKKFHVSPFAKSTNGRNTIHMLCRNRGYEDMLVFLLKFKYKFYNSKRKRKFDLGEALSVTSGYGVNTALHHCASRDNRKCYQILIDHGIDKNVVNYRGWVALQLTSPKMKFFRNHKKRERAKNILDCVTHDKVNALDCSYNKLLKYNSRFLYCIISVADSPDPFKTTVYKQLLKIKKMFKGVGNLVIDIQRGFENKKLNINNVHTKKEGKQFAKQLNKNKYIYKLKIDHLLAGKVATILGMTVYNQRHKYHTKYLKADRKYYEPFRDIQKQRILLFVILREFNLFKFEKQGLVVTHFPVHHFRYRNYIDVYWKKYFWLTLFEPLSFRTNYKALRPLTQIAFYHGIQNGFYFGFLTFITSFMLPMAIFGFGCYLYGLFYPNGFDNQLFRFISIVNAIWVTLFFEAWKRREKVLAYNFDVLGTQKDERPRFGYHGNYKVNKTSGNVVKFNSFTAFKRRLIVRFFLKILFKGRYSYLHAWVDFNRSQLFLT